LCIVGFHSLAYPGEETNGFTVVENTWQVAQFLSMDSTGPVNVKLLIETEKLTDDQIAKVCSAPAAGRIISFDLYGSKRHPVDVAGVLSGLPPGPALEEIHMVGVPVGDAVLVALDRFSGLRELSISSCKAAWHGDFTPLAKIRKYVITENDGIGSPVAIDPSMIAAVSAMARLEALKLNGIVEEARLTAALQGISTLRVVSLHVKPGIEGVLPILAGQKQLVSMSLRGSGITLTSLSRYPWPMVTALEISQPDDDQDLDLLAKFPALVSLEMGASNLTDAGVARLVRAIPKVTSLSLVNCVHPTDASVAALMTLSHLDSLFVRDSQITAEGYRSLLAQHSYKRMAIGMDKLGRDGYFALKKQFPDTRFF
jgi:hypothetical protein